MRPLHGVRVVDISRLLPGPMCTWYLQGLGAEIIKVEPPGTGDYLRHVPPFGPDGIGAWFTAVNAGKRSVVLDFRSAEGVSALRAMVDGADVLVEGFRPGVLSAIGLEPRALLEARPELIIASISGFGQTGPWRTRPGHDLGYCAVTGMLELSRQRDGVPDMPGLQLADMAGGAMSGALQVAAALFARERTGRGAWLDVSMTDGVLGMMAPVLTATAISGESPLPGQEPLTGGTANYQLYRCSDGRLIAFPPLEPKFWRAFLDAVGEDLPMNIERLSALFATRPRDVWAELLVDACVTPVLDPLEVLEHPLHRARGLVVGEGTATRIRAPFADAPDPVAAPALGAHTAEVLGEVGLNPSPLLQGDS